MEITSGSSSPKIKWATLLIISTAYIAVMANIQGFKALFPLVQDDFGISRAQAGLYTSFYFLSATLVAIFSGYVVDLLGAKKGLIIGVVTVGLLMILHSLAPFFSVILIFAFFTGVGFSLITPSVNKGVLEHVQPGKRAFSMGITHGGGGFGGFFGAAVLPYLGVTLGWRAVLLYTGIFAIFIALFLFKFYHDNPCSQQKEENVQEKSFSIKGDLFFLLKKRYLISVCLMGTVFGMTISSITTHYTLYLNQDVGFAPETAGLSLAIFMIGGIVGQPSWGLVNDNILGSNRRKGLLILGILVSFSTIFFGLFVGRMISAFYLVTFLSFILGFFTFGIPGVFFTAIGEMVSSSYTGIATGLALIFTRLGVVVTPPLFGYLADIRGSYSFSWILLGIITLIISLTFFYLSAKYGKRRTTDWYDCTVEKAAHESWRG